jgi:hypothetical protein
VRLEAAQLLKKSHLERQYEAIVVNRFVGVLLVFSSVNCQPASGAGIAWRQ